MNRIEFWFDFSSPYAYFAALQIEEVAARPGCALLWRPFLLGAALRATGMQPLSRTPLRGDYARRDWARLARRHNVPFRLPAAHPVLTVAAGRAFQWLETEAEQMAVPFAKSVFDAAFGQGKDIGDTALIVGLAEALGADGEDLAAALASEALKDRFRARTDEAVARGVFGSPFFFVDGEPFWGADRLPMVEDWLSSGGW
ncbi:MAG TPA: 2-hydroxychromene-2-carboxylate isomerase [Afifellaceae bacterium]|nr:2-hydroxychromene-2-carboxylate isomerase [Afifellaceae bacterium]